MNVSAAWIPGLEVVRVWSRRVANQWHALIEPHAETPLITAARAGDAMTVERLLQNGADANVQDVRGRTALHYAAARAHAETAACLLAYGVDRTLADAKGRHALGRENVALEDLHAIRQRYHRFCRSDARIGTTSPRADAWARDLGRRGIVKISGLIEPDALTRLRREFEHFVRSLERKMAHGAADKKHYFEEEHWWPDEGAFITNNAFKYSLELVRVCCHPELLETAHLYLGRRPFIQRGLAMRYLARASTNRDMFRWHHDLEDKRFKVMILLTDVGPGDQHMSYVCGSHTLFHPYRMFVRNVCDLDYCRRHLPSIDIYDAIGKAGDVFLFDTNGAHRGIRRETGSVRDVYLVEFNASAANVWGGDVVPDVLDDIRLQNNPFERLVATRKKWEQSSTQSLPSWIASLPIVESWL